MKKVIFLSFIMLMTSVTHAQGWKDKMAGKLAKAGKGGPEKVVEPPEGDYSDPTGISGTYYPTTRLPYGDGKKVAKLIKLECDGNHKCIMHAAKNEDNPDVFYMEDWMEYARDNYNLYEFKVRVSSSYFHLMSVEPGVVVFGAFRRAPKETPGWHSHLMVADTSKLKPVILVKDETKIDKYSHADAVKLIGELGTLSEVSNTLRIGEKTPLPSIGRMNEDKSLVDISIKLMKEKWADSREPENFKGCYIYNDDWAEVQYGKIMSVHKTTFSDEVTAIMLFKDKGTGICYYYAVGISRESHDISADGIEYDKYLHMTGTSTIQYITQEKLDAQLAVIGQ